MYSSNNKAFRTPYRTFKALFCVDLKADSETVEMIEGFSGDILWGMMRHNEGWRPDRQVRENGRDWVAFHR